jgi:hypothetical protein
MRHYALPRLRRTSPEPPGLVSQASGSSTLMSSRSGSSARRTALCPARCAAVKPASDGQQCRRAARQGPPLARSESPLSMEMFSPDNSQREKV